MPGVGLGDPAADNRAERRREHGDHPGKRRRNRMEAFGKQQEHRREHGRNQRPPGEPLENAPADE
jgi:hypothetical protein